MGSVIDVDVPVYVLAGDLWRDDGRCRRRHPSSPSPSICFLSQSPQKDDPVDVDEKDFEELDPVHAGVMMKTGTPHYATPQKALRVYPSGLMREVSQVTHGKVA
jgi:hypothetical protein